MLNFLLFDGAKLLCNNRNAKKKHFARLAKRMTIQHVDLYPMTLMQDSSPAHKRFAYMEKQSHYELIFQNPIRNSLYWIFAILSASICIYLDCIWVPFCR